MSKLCFVILLGLFALTISSCKELIAPDISNEIPVLILPSVNDTVNQNPVQFKWQAMEGASKYHLEIVSPSFGNIYNYVLDSIISGTEFIIALDSAEYELKLTAMNGGYESITLGPVHFWVGVQPSTGGSNVVLVAPAVDAYVSPDFEGPFTWNSIFGATSYEFSLREGTVFATGDVIDFQNGIATTSINLSNSVALDEGNYIWGVKAYLNSGSETAFSTRSFSVDATDPNTPVGPFLPSGTFEFGIVNFSWTNGSDVGAIQSPVQSVIEIAFDAGFSSIYATETVSTNNVSIDMSGAAVGTYFWRVYNFDSAGNTSSYSATSQFSYN